MQNERSFLLEETKKWRNERKELNEEKIMMEYILFDLLKSSDANKDITKRIRKI
jgi:hypothetical protein